ncbi:MAG TPA: AI-2E family transporter [Verrucomicrobiae bacterium]|nr:AI-2E family transporter [Verrucomicrobiae bacterium]
MPDENRRKSSGESNSLLTILVVVTVLYFARTVIIPFVFAILVAFLLAPLAIRLRHWGLGRAPSAVLVVLLSFLIVGAIGATMAAQLGELGHKLPEYQQNIHKKLQSLRTSGGGLIAGFSRVIRNFADELNPPAPPASGNQRTEERPVPVEIRRLPFSPLAAIQKVLGSLLDIVLTAAIVVVFAMFMLIEREALRDRLIRLVGTRRVNLTTRLLDDAAHRVSRYLLAQLIVNLCYGTLTGIGLWLMKVPNPFLWAMLAALLRYIPYLGIWVAAAMPAAIAFAVEPGWVKVPLIFGLYFGIDLITYNFVEPVVYGNSTGLSGLAVLVAAVFWTWLWGPVGLLLSTPLTVCVVVLGRYVPNLAFLQILLTDKPGLPPQVRFYQRMLAMELVEARQVAEEFLKGKSLEELFDSMIIPALSLAEEDRHRGKLGERRQRFLFQNTRKLIEELAQRPETIASDSSKTHAKLPIPAPQDQNAPPGEKLEIFCIPARDEADAIAALMMVQLLDKRSIAARALPPGLAGESVETVVREAPKVVCVLAVPPFGYMHARYLCRRLREQIKGLKIVGGVLTEQDVQEIRERQPSLGADELASSLQQGLAQILALLPLQAAPTHSVS